MLAAHRGPSRRLAGPPPYGRAGRRLRRQVVKLCEVVKSEPRRVSPLPIPLFPRPPHTGPPSCWSLSTSGPFLHGRAAPRLRQARATVAPGVHFYLISFDHNGLIAWDDPVLRLWRCRPPGLALGRLWTIAWEPSAGMRSPPPFSTPTGLRRECLPFPCPSLEPSVAPAKWRCRWGCLTDPAKSWPVGA